MAEDFRGCDDASNVATYILRRLFICMAFQKKYCFRSRFENFELFLEYSMEEGGYETVV